jgi:alkylation response protein AidB-like acyl-CoA dehydrogenase
MNLELSDEQRLIVNSASDFLLSQCPIEKVRQFIDLPGTWDVGLWKEMACLGWYGVHTPVSQNGLGLGIVELALIQEMLGQHLACTPFFETTAVSATVLMGLAAYGPAEQVLAEQLEGRERVVTALPYPGSHIDATLKIGASDCRLSGHWPIVSGAPTATQLLLPVKDDSGTAHLVLIPTDARSLHVRIQSSIDPTRPLGHVDATDCRVNLSQCVAAGATVNALLERTRSVAAIAMAAEQIGVAEAALQLTLSYTRDRQQFGRPIASFQAVKHRCALMLVMLESARSAVYGAASTANTPLEDRELRFWAAHAFTVATDAALFCTRESIQLHGGVGFTWEYDPHLYLRRAQANSQRLGTLRWWHEEAARHLIDREIKPS